MLDIMTQRLTVADFLKDVEPKYPDWIKGLRSDFDEHLEEMPFIRKGFELTPDDISFPEGSEREEIAIISTLALDRDNEVLLPEGVDLRFYNKNKIVPYAHDYWALPVGVNRWIKIDSKEAPTALIAKTKYSSQEANPIGYQVFLLHQEGILTAKSVGFIPTAWKDSSDDDWVDVVNSWRDRRARQSGRDRRFKEGDPTRIYTKWVLLEYSPVAVPSNPEAVSLAVQKGILTQEDAKARGLMGEPVDEVIDEIDDTREPEYIRLHPEEKELLVEVRDMLVEMKDTEPVEEPSEDIIEIEDDPEDEIDIDLEMVKEVVAEVLAEPVTEPPPDVKIRLDKGEVI